MMDVDRFRQSHVDMLSRSENCTLGNPWVWTYMGQCLEDVEQDVGFGVGMAAIVVCSIAHICLIRLQYKHSRSAKSRLVRLFVSMNWCSDLLGCVGAVLAQQLASQIFFGLWVTLLHTCCCMFVCAMSPRSKSKDAKPGTGKGRSLTRKKVHLCAYPLSLLFATSMFVGLYQSGISVGGQSSHNYITRGVTGQTHSQVDLIPVTWMMGYILGAMAAVLHCSVKLIDIVDSYISIDCGRSVVMAYVTSCLGDVMYVTSVVTQDQSISFFNHSLPWILPRMIAAGLDIGILIQRAIQKKRGRRRTLSQQDAECLLSSDESELEFSSSGSEEVIWMPLKSVELARPQHPVCASRIQTDSETQDLDTSRDSQGNEPQTTCLSNQEDGPDIEVQTVRLTKRQDPQCIETQIASLNTVSGEEKIVTWINNSSATSTETNDE